MKIGDKVKMSEKNPNHLGRGVCAYAGMEGVVDWMAEDGSFSLDCRDKTGSGGFLVVPMNDARKRRKKGIWIYLNGWHTFHRSDFSAEDARHRSAQRERRKLWLSSFFRKLLPI